jgi:hypothetical protein
MLLYFENVDSVKTSITKLKSLLQNADSMTVAQLQDELAEEETVLKNCINRNRMDIRRYRDYL